MYTSLPPSAGREGLKKQAATRMILLLYLILHFLAASAQQEDRSWEKQWCIADEQTPDDILQQALSWACGPGGADCTMIEPNKSCYLPNTVRDHASYAFNRYWQKFKNHGGSCYFNAAAMVTDLDPTKVGQTIATLSSTRLNEAPSAAHPWVLDSGASGTRSTSVVLI